MFFDDFESGTSKWTEMSGLWHITDSTSSWNDSYHSPTHSMWYGQESTGDYATGSQTNGSIISIPFSLLGVSKAYLTFFHWRQGELSSNTSGSNWDKSFVYMTTNAGASWDLLYSNKGNVSPWENVTLNITRYCGNSSIQLRFYFDTIDGFVNNYRGWLVDDVEVYGVFPPPQAPRNPVATPYHGYIVLTWLPPASNGGSAITNYNIYRGTSSGGEVLVTTLGNVTTWTDTGRVAGQTYYYEISAINSIMEGFLSSEVNAMATIASTVPSTPQNLAATPGNSQVVLGWQAPVENGGSAITNYGVYRGTSTGSEVFAAKIGNVTTWTDTGRTNGQIYFYTIIAINGVGNSTPSNEASARAGLVPGPPQNIFATPVNGQVTLTWQTPVSIGSSAITNYKIYRSTSSGGENYIITLGNVNTWTDTGLVPGQKYYYKVSAVNSIGEGLQSNEANATVPKTQSSAPTGLSPNEILIFIVIAAVAGIVVIAVVGVQVHKKKTAKKLARAGSTAVN